MLSATVVASLLSLAALATAQAGRFPCDPLVATSCENLVATGNESGADLFKSDGFTPVGAACAADPASGFFFCGYTGAACNPLNTGVQSACDNGVCTETDPLVPTVGTCTGSFGTACGSTETVCLGYLYCTGEDTLTTSSDACGGLGAYCQDPNLGGFPTAAENQPIYSATCQTNYCNAGTANCDNRVPAGGDCSVDPEFGCIDGFTCSAAFICEATISPSGNARTRRNAQLSKRGVCPSSHTACPLPESRRGFECIDTESNLEQCGACFTNGGVDCTAIEGVDAVGCVSGQCEIWACASGFSFDHSSGSCVVALVA